MKRSGLIRITTHLLLGGVTLALYLMTAGAGRVDLFIIALGYLSLLLICASLLIGPLNLLRKRRNPLNIDVRRDVGIWAAIAGCWHVLLVLRGDIFSNQALLYFLREGCCGYIPQLNIFGISNDLGLGATLLLLMLLALSNNFALRALKGRRWKQLQRLSYPLLLLAVAHTLGYQYLGLRGPLLLALLIALVALTLAGQGLGFALTLSRRRGSSKERAAASERH